VSGADSDRGGCSTTRDSRRAPEPPSALEALSGASSLPTVDAPPNHSKGCGAVMRVAPCGLGAATRELAFELARDTGVITHGHPSGYLSAAYFAALVWDLARGGSLGACPMRWSARGNGADELAHLDRADLARRCSDGDQGARRGLTGEECGDALLCALTSIRASRSVRASAVARQHTRGQRQHRAIRVICSSDAARALSPAWLACRVTRCRRAIGDLHARWSGRPASVSTERLRRRSRGAGQPRRDA
jgi:hypothetical protein